MIPAAMLMALAAPLIEDAERSERLTTRNIEVDGWYCQSTDCVSSSKRDGNDLLFDADRSKIELTKREMLSKSWIAILNCRVSGAHLRNCRIDPKAVILRSAASSALKIAKRIYLASHPPRQRGNLPNVSISVMYSPGECGWQCVPTLTPPAALGGK